MNFKFYSLVVLVWAAALAGAVAGPREDQRLAVANNGFAFKLLKELIREQPGKNLFISPYSAATVLQIVGNGAGGRTKAELNQVLGTAGLSPGTVNSAGRDIVQALNTGSTNVILTTANAIWYRLSAPVRPEFLAGNQDSFGATIAPLDFTDPRATDVINAWAADQTHGRITQIADGLIDPAYTRLFLANAVYFKGKWEDPFDAADTKERPFHLRGGGRETVPLMTKTKSFTYRQGSGYQAVRLPYEDASLAMYVFLPDPGFSPEKLLGIMNGGTWQRVTKPGFSDRSGTLMFPRFKLEYNVELKKPLSALGMKTAFNTEEADFSGIAPNLYISAVVQKAFIEVKEEGTEAAAVTGLTFEAASIEMPPPHPFEMIVDRPFLLLIEDQQTGTILFMGIIFDPWGTAGN